MMKPLFLNSSIYQLLLVVITLFMMTGCFRSSQSSLNDNVNDNLNNNKSLLSNVATYRFQNEPFILSDPEKGNIQLGGFSGLSFDGIGTSTQELTFTTITDKLPSSINSSTLFVPSIVTFHLNINTNKITLKDLLPIKPTITNDLDKYTDFDYEGIVKTDSNDYWIVEESIPALIHVDSTGKILQRFIPINTNVDKLSIDIEALPEKYNHLKKNGFEGIALNKENNKVYLFLQNKLKPKMIDFDGEMKHTSWIVEFDINKQIVTAEYLYPSPYKLKLSGASHYKDNKFLVIERIENKKLDETNLNIMLVDLNNATNVQNKFILDDQTLRLKKLSSIETLKPVELIKYIDLNAFGFNEDSKFEGIAYLGDEKVAIINDNDFSVESDATSNLVIIDIK